MKRQWSTLFYSFFVVIFLYPSMTIFGIDEVWSGSIFMFYKCVVYALLVGFFFYPFVKVVEMYKEKLWYPVIGYGVLGIVAPVISGLFMVFLFEVIAKFRSHERGPNNA